MSGVVYPELVHGRRDGFQQGAWVIEDGSANRGGASCNLSERHLRVPGGDDELSRVVRAHELMHIRVSPHRRGDVALDREISGRALECAEEFRINHLLASLGFDVGLLHDGSERVGARRLADAGDWPEAVCFFLAVMGTGAEGDYLRGLRSSQPTWSTALRAIRKRVLAHVGELDAAQVGCTDLTETGVPRGYHDVSIPVAALVSRTMGAMPPDGPEALRAFRRSLEPGARRAPSAVFAEVCWDTTLETQARPGRRVHRRARPSAFGTEMRYPGRLLTDPMCRAFARKSTVLGGVIVIDQSGSMDVTLDELDGLLASAPGALIVGYSHRPGDRGATPNAWILAGKDRVVTRARSGNIGNGVDGPILRWAIRHSRGQPIMWVTDGQVTDSNDHPCHTLSVECAQLVRRHRIFLVRGLDEVESALRGTRTSPSGFGRVGKEVQLLGRC